MLKDIIEVRPLDGYRLHLRFKDGAEGIVDVAKLVKFTGGFAPIKERDFFVQVQVNPVLGTICWPNEADLDQDVLYAIATGQPLPIFDQTIAQHPTH